VVLVGRCTHGHGCAATSISLPLNQCDSALSSTRPTAGEDHEALLVSATSSAFRFRTDPNANLFNVPRHDTPSTHHRELRATAMQAWRLIARLHAE
jgi:hypothetical protein